MNTNLFHTILLVLSTLVGAFLQFDWTSFGVSEGTAAQIAGIVVMISSIVKILLTGIGSGQTALVKKDQ